MSKKSIKIDPAPEEEAPVKDEIFKKHKRFTLSKTTLYSDPKCYETIDPQNDETTTATPSLRSGPASTSSSKQRINLKRNHPDSIGTDSSGSKSSDEDSSSSDEEEKA